MHQFQEFFYSLYAKYLIWRYVNYKRLLLEDRDILERIVFPYLLIHLRPRKILDIGREDYEKFYNLFFIGKELWTIDKDPAKAEFGAKRHIIDNAANLKKYFPDNYFDLVIMNGVFGWGLNDPLEIEATFSAVYDILKKGGAFIFGWNNDDEGTPVPLAQIEGLKKFIPYYFPPFSATTVQSINSSHTYNFYAKS